MSARTDDKDTTNQGEGDKASAERFNKAEQAFVRSPAGQEAIAHAGEEDEATQREDEAAAETARARAKEEDPAITRRPARSSEND